MHIRACYIPIIRQGDTTMFTTALIPTSGVFITQTYFSKGFQVARYDHEGLTSQVRWFTTAESAQAYAMKLMAH